MKQKVTLGPGQSQKVSFLIAPTDSGVYAVKMNGLTGSFEVMPEGSIAIVSPTGGEQWKRGGTYDITWASEGIDEVELVIREWLAGETISRSIIPGWARVSATLGKYTWTIPVDLPLGNTYTVRINGFQNGKYITFDESGFMSIIE